jgi:hypothetical protein
MCVDQDLVLVLADMDELIACSGLSLTRAVAGARNIIFKQI